jgi:hypothetical protein
MRQWATLLFAALFVSMILPLATAHPSIAKPRPTVSDSMDCWGDPSTIKGSGDRDTDSVLLSWCCYDDGCWICPGYQEEHLSQCEWVPKSQAPGGNRAPPFVGIHPPANPPPARHPGPPPFVGVHPPGHPPPHHHRPPGVHPPVHPPPRHPRPPLRPPPSRGAKQPSGGTTTIYRRSGGGKH